MILKIFKVVWFVSLLGMLGVFVYCYASWPQLVNFSEQEGGLKMDKGILFYTCLGFAALFNALVFVITRLKYSEAFSTWFYGLVSVFHAFLVSGFIFITIFNSLEKYDYSMVGPTLYASIILLMLWSVAWPVYSMYTRFSTQAKVG
jgi:hypothetical protein